MDDSSFSFSLPTPPRGTPVTADEAERILLARLEAGPGHPGAPFGSSRASTASSAVRSWP